MAINDFFLVERAAQLQRLRSATAGNHIEIPNRYSRLNCSAGEKALYGMMDQISKIPLSRQRQKWKEWLSKYGGHLLRLRRKAESQETDTPLLTPDQHGVIEGFERQLVQLLLDESVGVNATANEIFTAIRNDQPHFSGLKPMEFHADNFAHELLFPSWLNLYTALTLPRADSSEPRFSSDQVKTLFHCLTKLEKTGEKTDAELVGILTLIANRLPPESARRLMQRMLDLSFLKNHGPTAASVEKLVRLRDLAGTTDDLLQKLRDLVTFETAAFANHLKASCSLVPELPRYASLPEFITKHVQTLEQNEDQAAAWMTLVSRIAHLIDQGDGITAEYAAVLQKNSDRLSDWLAILSPNPDSMPLPATSQNLLAKIIARTKRQHGTLDINLVRPFASQIAPRLNLLDAPAALFFEKEFITQDRNRELLLRISDAPARRSSITQQLVTHASKSHDRTHLMSQLVIAAVFDPEYDSAKLAGIRRTLTVLRMLQEQGFISSNQLEDLAGDIRRRLPGSREFLIAPFLGAAEQEGRLAKLYMALYEECEKFEHSGEIGNFGLTSAAYGNLNRTIDREST